MEQKAFSALGAALIGDLSFELTPLVGLMLLSQAETHKDSPGDND